MSVDWMATHRKVLRWAAVGAPILLAAVLALLRDQLTPSTAATVLVLAVVGASATGDRAAGVASAVSAAVAFDLSSRWRTTACRSTTATTSSSRPGLVVVGLAVTELALWGRRQQAAGVMGEPSPNAPVVERDALVRIDGRDLCVDRRGLPTDLVTVISVSRGEHVLGHFTLVAATHVVRPGRDQLRAAILLAEQMTRQERSTGRAAG